MTPEMLRAVSAAPVGSRVWFKHPKQAFTIRARSRRFIVCTRPMFKSILYTVIDLKDGVRGPVNNAWNACTKTDEDCQKMIANLEKRGPRRDHLDVSDRRCVPLDVSKVEPPKVEKPPRKVKCDDCSRTEPHMHCPECGSVEHAASHCDMMG